jgi:hypothetical protein
MGAGPQGDTRYRHDQSNGYPGPACSSRYPNGRGTELKPPTVWVRIPPGARPQEECVRGKRGPRRTSCQLRGPSPRTPPRARFARVRASREPGRASRGPVAQRAKVAGRQGRLQGASGWRRELVKLVKPLGRGPPEICTTRFVRCNTRGTSFNPGRQDRGRVRRVEAHSTARSRSRNSRTRSRSLSVSVQTGEAYRRGSVPAHSCLPSESFFTTGPPKPHIPSSPKDENRRAGVSNSRTWLIAAPAPPVAQIGHLTLLIHECSRRRHHFTATAAAEFRRAPGADRRPTPGMRRPEAAAPCLRLVRQRV